MLHCCVLMVYNTLYKFVNTQQDGFCQKQLQMFSKTAVLNSEYSHYILSYCLNMKLTLKRGGFFFFFE